MKPICIVAAKRTPQGKLLGALTSKSAVDLALVAGKAALEGIAPEEVDEVILGNVLAAGQGMNIARQVSIGVGIPDSKTAFTVNMMCASGMQAVILAAESIQLGKSHVVLCGGTESMTNAPHLLTRARTGYKLGDGVLVDSVLRDGLVDTFSNDHMGLTAEKLAEEYSLTRTEQDAFAQCSQQRWGDAQKSGVYEQELVPMKELAQDEHPRPEVTLEQLAKLRPAFKPDGTVTAGNSSGINDGAAILLLCDLETAQKHGWTPLALMTGWTSVGCDPYRMGLGPVHATRKLLDMTGWTLAQFDQIELNEAFASQSLACIKELGLDPERVNVHGGAIAIGHPIGASGARIITHLAHCHHRGETKQSFASLCIGGGMGATVALQSV